MKVLFCCYPHVGVNQGGMYHQIQNTAKALQALGIEVLFQDPWKNQLAECDICHFFSTHEAHFGLFEQAVNLNIACVWSSVLNVFDKSLNRLKAEVFLSSKVPGFLPSWKKAKSLAQHSIQLIALNEQEQNCLKLLFALDDQKVCVIPNGVDLTMSSSSSELFRNYLNIQGKYVLNVAYFCRRKNQLSLIHAAIDQEWDLVLIGKLDDSKYVRECIAAAKPHSNIHIYGELPYGSELLSSAYAGATTFCLPSFSEVQPLTLIEAAQNKCNLVVSDSFPLQEYFVGASETCDPHDIQSIRNAILKSLNSQNKSFLAVASQPSWAEVATEINKIYINCTVNRKTT